MPIKLYIIKLNNGLIAELADTDSGITFQCFFRTMEDAQKALAVVGSGKIYEVEVMI